MTIRVALGQFNELTDEKLQYAAQLGLTSVQLNNPLLPGESRWDVADLRALVEKAAAYGLTLEAIENVPMRFYNLAMVGLPGAAEQIENYCATIRAVGEAGIPVLGYHFMPNSVWRTSRTTPGRGGAHVTSFDLAEVEAAADGGKSFMPDGPGWADGLWSTTDPAQMISTEQMWDNYRTFMNATLPVAREAGVTMALHPDDPPVPMLGGVARLFISPSAFEKAEEIAEESGAGSAWGLDLCLGSTSEMVGGAAAVEKMITTFGPRGRIIYVHFRDVQGTVPVFQESFLGEGNYDPAATMQLLADSGFEGFLLDDHVPHMVDDTPWNHRGRAHAVGYMQGLIAMMNHK